MSKFKEAEIFINGVKLGIGHSLTLGVAISQFLQDLTPEYKADLGDIGASYEARALEILNLMVSPDQKVNS